MGLVQAAVGSIGGPLADQWKDFYTVPDGLPPTAALFAAVPRGTPATLVQRLEAEVAKAVQDPALAQSLRQRGIEPGFRNATDFAAHLRRELSQWKAVVDFAKIVVD